MILIIGSTTEQWVRCSKSLLHVYAQHQLSSDRRAYQVDVPEQSGRYDYEWFVLSFITALGSGVIPGWYLHNQRNMWKDLSYLNGWTTGRWRAMAGIIGVDVLQCCRCSQWYQHCISPVPTVVTVGKSCEMVLVLMCLGHLIPITNISSWLSVTVL